MSSIAKKCFMVRLAEVKGDSSNVEFAKRCGLNTQDVQRYMKGEATPSIDKLASIASTCDVSSDWLIGLSDLKGKPPSEVTLRVNVTSLKRAATRICADADSLMESITALQEIVK